MANSGLRVVLVDPTTNDDYRTQNGAGGDNLATTQVSVGTTATLLVNARAKRKNLILTNITGTQRIYVGPTNAVTTATGIPVPGTALAGIALAYTGTLYGVAETAVQTFSVAEVY